MDLFLYYLTQPYLVTGIVYTLLITGFGLVGGMIMGIFLASMQLCRFRILAIIARTYAIIFRGTPLILQMIFCYNALPIIGIKLTEVEAASLALSLNEAPFIAEVIRANILTVDRGQIAAGEALGMIPITIMLRIVSPQAIRTMVPALGNETINALKNSSLASVVSVQELTLRSTQLASSTFDFFSIFFASGLMYLVLTGAVAIIQIIVEMMLDLDAPHPRERFARLLPWNRAEMPALATNSRGPARSSLVAPITPSVSPDGAVPEDLPQPSVKAARPIDKNRRWKVLSRSGSAVEISNLHKSYSGKGVLESLNLHVRVGEVVALLGPSGSGKSTLLRCINHLEGWDSGTIKVLGRKIGVDERGHTLSPREISNARASVGVGMVFQNFNLFGHLTARENIAGPLRWVQGLSAAEADRRAVDLLERVGLSHRLDALPRHMSGGQQQRVAIARALAPNPAILLLDEPTSALDPELVSEVLEVIRRLTIEDGLTMMISTHQMAFARDVADRAIFLADGAIIEEGPAAEVLTHPENPRTAQFLQIIAEDVSQTAKTVRPK